jgi:hypothetical protein
MVGDAIWIVYCSLYLYMGNELGVSPINREISGRLLRQHTHL